VDNFNLSLPKQKKCHRYIKRGHLAHLHLLKRQIPALQDSASSPCLPIKVITGLGYLALEDTASELIVYFGPDSGSSFDILYCLAGSKPFGLRQSDAFLPLYV
jgi:hypothetical protein